MLDIDHFKHINDRYGHAAGDEVLTAFAKTVYSILRQGDLFGRLGGEEFAIVLPRTQIDHAAAVAERIRTQVANTSICLADGQQIHITVSIGLAFLSTDQTTTLKSLLNAADESLYRAKASGRNRVTAVTFNA